MISFVPRKTRLHLTPIRGAGEAQVVRHTISFFDQNMPDEDLQEYRRQFEVIQSDAQNLLCGLSESQFIWQSNLYQWSIGHCINHLIVTGRDSLGNLQNAIIEARAKELFSQGPFKYRSIEKWFVRQMEPPVRVKMKAPKAYAPTLECSSYELIHDFFLVQEEFLRCIEEARGIDLSKAKVWNPVSKWVRFSLGQEIALNAAHNRRHLWQVREITMSKGFPGMSASV